MENAIEFNTITKDNIAKLSILIKQLISCSDFISIDTEFTGLKLEHPSPEFNFDLRKWNNRNPDMEERYKALRLLVSSHAIVSIGLSLFKKNPESLANTDSNKYTNSHLISPSSISFLAENGFDFNLQAKNGIRYAVATTKPEKQNTNSLNNTSKPAGNKHQSKKRRQTLSIYSDGTSRSNQTNSGSLSNSKLEQFPEGKILSEIILSVLTSKSPIIVHNGLLDLLFLFHSFVLPLPPTIDFFISDLSSLLCAPIFDTKYLSEKMETEKSKLANNPFLDIVIQKEINLNVLTTPSKSQPNGNPQTLKSLDVNLLLKSQVPFCKQFASHGYCGLDTKCPLSHDLNFILSFRQASKSEQKVMIDTFRNNLLKTQLPFNATDLDGIQPLQQSVLSTPTQNEQNSRNYIISQTYHSGVFDAYMTGYIYASISHTNQLDSYKNKIYLIGKDIPLIIQKSKFSANSQNFIAFKESKLDV
ncbi:hypothetical protein BB560_006901 [Smittium megazygosporum]|uniref:C3H1-type domain-containing protein n=1 Tax=Smittium megazygosporum TaxID=133381 RepID=A0A2T9Y0E8_9FUNG|nr:hypothetical protein BB560_006901 [Smittium megazygosporum]